MADQDNANAIATGRTFVWHEVCGATAADAVKFYTEALDFGTMEMPMGGTNYTMLTRDGQPVCGVLGTSEVPGMENVPPHWATYLSVDDVDARLAKCESLGATIMAPAFDVPTVGRMGLIKDPQGAVIWLFKAAT